jgi:CheY-like chemotaxis protein
MMPGLETTAPMRQTEEGRNMPVVALTANAVSGMREMFLSEGMNDFLSKPIDPGKPDSILRKWLPNEKMTANIEKTSAEPAAGYSALPLRLINLPGLDAARGLSAADGLAERDINLLEMFCRDTLARLPVSDKIPVSSEFKNFTAQVHSLKSALAPVGARNFSAGAGFLETAGRQADAAAIGFRLLPLRDGLKNWPKPLRRFWPKLRTLVGVI